MKTESCSMQSDENKIEIEFEGLNFQGYIGMIIADEFYTCKKKYKNQISYAPCPIKLVLCDEGERIWEIIKDMKDGFDKKELHKMLSTYRSTSSFCEAVFHGKEIEVDNISVIGITDLLIRIYTDRLNDFIINHLDSLDTVIESIKLSVRHEMGHIIDFIHYNGMESEKFIKLRERYEKERKEFYKSLADGKILSIDDLKRYHQLEEESIANSNADISEDEKLKYDKILSDINHIKLKTTITLGSKHEPIKDEEK